MKILIHAHLFYPEVVDEVLNCVQNYILICGENAIRLIVTYPNIKPELVNLVRGKVNLPDMLIVPVGNRGYDIGPFFTEVLNKNNLDDFNYIVKLHTKRDTPLMWVNYRPYQGSEWRKALLSFCSTKEAVQHSLAAFDAYPRLGMLADHRMINYSGSDCLDVVQKTRNLLKEWGVEPRHMLTISGSVFMVRAALLKPLVGRFVVDDFIDVKSENIHKDYGVACLLEFAFSMTVDAQGYLVSEGIWPVSVARIGYGIKAILYRLLRKLSNGLKVIIGSSHFNRVLQFAVLRK